MEPSSSHSYFKKTVTLRNWWLIKPETHDDVTKALGVSGTTCTSQHTAAVRCFTSAPISKVFDIIELETVDDVCIILLGFINKERTLENGFSPEVFNHFVFGFPVNWEEFATSCPKKRSTAIRVSEVVEPNVKKRGGGIRAKKNVRRGGSSVRTRGVGSSARRGGLFSDYLQPETTMEPTVTETRTRTPASSDGGTSITPLRNASEDPFPVWLKGIDPNDLIGEPTLEATTGSQVTTTSNSRDPSSKKAQATPVTPRSKKKKCD